MIRVPAVRSAADEPYTAVELVRPATQYKYEAKHVGLISDTHGQLRPEAVRALVDCDLLIHAGDVGHAELLLELGKIAPVIAVRGNVDVGAFGRGLPERARINAGGTIIYVLHDVQELGSKDAEGAHVVVSGHSHKAGSLEREGVLYVNPGSAGPRRFRLPITVARLDLWTKPLRVEFVELTTIERNA